MLDDQFALVAYTRRSYAPTTANDRSLTPVFGRFELDAVSEIGSCISVGVNLDLVQGARSERLGRRRFWRGQIERRVYIEDYN